MSSLRSRTINSLFWSLSDSFGAYFLRFGFSIAVARALSPSDYGLMGMIIIFISIGTIITESGFGMALIQKKDASDIDFSTIFYFNLIVSIVIYLALFFSANIIADFYNEPILINVTRVAAFTIVLGGLSTIQTVLLQKELNFKKQTYISYIATIISGTTGVIVAYKGFAVWALVFQTIAGSLIRLIALWLTSKWRPSFQFRRKSFVSMYRYGYKVFLSGLSDIVFTKLYFPLIGKYFSSEQLGYYTNATSFSGILVRQTAISYGRVLFPAISLIQDDRERLSRSYIVIFRLLSFVMFPVTIIAFVSSGAFIDFFLTTKWLPAVPYIQLFLIEGFFFSIYMLNQNTFSAIGLSGLTLKVEIFKKSLVFISLLITFKFGIKALITGQIVSSLIAFIYTLFHIKKRIKLNISHLLKELFKLIVITAIIVIVDYLLFSGVSQASWKLLLGKIVLLPVVYLLSVYLFKVRGLNDICNVFSAKMPASIKSIIRLRFPEEEELN